jgi:predicted metal-dependent phosphoesterase TrpH
MTINFDFHIHSIYSKDSILKPERIIKIARKKGLSGIAITDHNTIRGALKTKLSIIDDFVVIIGSEVKTEKGEITGLFLNEEIKSNKFAEVIEEIKDQDGISVLPHPYRNKLCDPKNLLNEVDIVEGLNARTPKELNYKAQSLAKSFGLPMIAGSDAHISFEIGSVQTIIRGNERTFDDIKKCLLKGEVIIKGKELPYHLQVVSAGIGRLRRDGMAEFTKSCLNKLLRI